MNRHAAGVNSAGAVPLDVLAQQPEVVWFGLAGVNRAGVVLHTAGDGERADVRADVDHHLVGAGNAVQGEVILGDVANDGQIHVVVAAAQLRATGRSHR